MPDRLRDVTASWGSIVATMPGAWPYHSPLWGNLLAEVFGGTFQVFELPFDGVCVPILSGGTLAADGFRCGHIGYGGALSPGADDLSLRAHIDAVAAVERRLLLPCKRLVTCPRARTAPVSTPHAGTVRETTLVDLPASTDILWSSYAGSVRTAVRKCRREGLTTRILGPAEAAAAAHLIGDTQSRVGAAYRVPTQLIGRLARDESGFAYLVGCFRGDALLAVGVFLRAFGRVAYLYNGWELEFRQLGANYLMLHQALAHAVAHSDRVMDLGFSHQRELRAFKERWGGRPADLIVVE
ncbi:MULTISPECIES: GNAT family N-acetyltransferase [Streptomyces]|uniref:GNAT family N-acetyltransferase n=1 Tax=Streptomyces TaxID=1883 RepID=UPI00093E7A52|nr:GNAT family N-acetyltransferase [Streptomyces sp. CB02115]